MEFKDVIRGLRLEKGLTQEEFAKELHVSMSTINKWENGKKKPSYDTIVFLCKYFNISADILLGLKEY